MPLLLQAIPEETIAHAYFTGIDYGSIIIMFYMVAWLI